MERILNEVVKFKVHIQKQLEEYEAFVADEVDREEQDGSGVAALEEGTRVLEL